MKYSEEERIKLVKEFKSSSLSKKEFSKAKGIHFNTLNNWLDLYDNEKISDSFIDITNIIKKDDNSDNDLMTLSYKGVNIDISAKHLDKVLKLIHLW